VKATCKDLSHFIFVTSPVDKDQAELAHAIRKLVGFGRVDVEVLILPIDEILRFQGWLLKEKTSHIVIYNTEEIVEVCDTGVNSEDDDFV